MEEWIRQEDSDDREVYEAILENREVIKRMEERIELVKKEVTEVRSLPWELESANANASEIGERPAVDGPGSATNGIIGGGRQANGTQAQEQTNGANNARAAADDEEGVFL